MRKLLLAAHGSLLGLTALNVAYLRRKRRARRAPPAWPRVSVLVPARNEEENLGRLLPSLLAQDYPAFEVVVVDDASEDGTWAVLEAHAHPRLRPLRGGGPPPGWLGKPYALHTAAAHATGALFLFLDADAALRDGGALRRLVERFAAAEAGAPGATVLTGLPQFVGDGGGLLLTSLVPFAVLSALPVALVPRTRAPSLSALNGQVWMMAAAAYRRHEPHRMVAAEVLEDVMIGRYAKRAGLRLVFLDLSGEVVVRMYRSWGEAWRGFRKNAYLVWGGRPLPFAALGTLYALLYVAAPLFGWPLLGTLYAIKGLADRAARLPLRVTALAPLVLAAGAALALDSALAHATGRVAWKGRGVGRESMGERGKG
jgi:glycosyltransferase involved in cell wall biosynthesis